MGLGGHFNSGLAMVKRLCSSGHTVHIVYPGGDKKKTEEFISCGATCQNLPELKRWNLLLPSLRGHSSLKEIVKSRQINIIHAQDYPSLSRAYSVAVITGTPLVSTFPGGNFFHHTPVNKAHTVIFSQEQIDNLSSRYQLNKEKLHLIRARIDTELYRNCALSDDFIQKYSLPEEGSKIFMATRFTIAKRAWFDSIFELAVKLKSKNDVRHIIIAGDGVLMDEIRRKAETVNRQCSRSVIHLTGSVHDARDLNMFYNYSDLVSGSGRGIMEAMAVGKPVIILNKSGMGQIVTPSNIDDVAYYNFSGRHFSDLKSDIRFSALIEQLLGDENQMKKLGESSKGYVRKYLDYQIGGEKLQNVYKLAAGSQYSWSDFIKWYFRAVLSGLSRIPVAIRNRI